MSRWIGGYGNADLYSVRGVTFAIDFNISSGRHWMVLMGKSVGEARDDSDVHWPAK